MFRLQTKFIVRLILGLLLAAGGGMMFVLAFPPFEIWPLALVGFVPVLVAQYRILPPRFSSIGSGLGIAVWLQGYLGPVFAPVGTFMVWLPLIAFVTTYLSDKGLRGFHGRTGYRWFVLAGIASWSGFEMIRLFLPVAGTWAFIAYPFYRQVSLIQPVAIFGIIGMGMVIMLINHVLALLLIQLLDSRWRPDEDAPILSSKLVRRWTAAGAVVSVLWLAGSLVMWNMPLDTPSVRAAAVQPDISPIVSFNQGKDVSGVHARMVEQTREAGAQGAEFIVWPEAGFTWDPQADNTLDFPGLASETGAYLALGYVVIGEEGFRNEATVLTPEGEYLGVFGKDHPVVFGGETSLTRGTYPVYDTSIGKIATVICYDIDYTDTTRKMAAQGAQLIGVPSNDWSTIADKHFSHAVFRAVENRVAVVKADGGFDSAIIDPKGQIIALASYPQGGEATLLADVAIGDGKGTFLTRLGDWTGWLGLAGMIFFAFGGKFLEKRAKSEDAGPEGEGPV